MQAVAQVLRPPQAENRSWPFSYSGATAKMQSTKHRSSAPCSHPGSQSQSKKEEPFRGRRLLRIRDYTGSRSKRKRVSRQRSRLLLSRTMDRRKGELTFDP